MFAQKDTVKQALREDAGKRDVTSELIIPKEKNVNAIIIIRQACLVCGMDIAKQVFKTRDPTIKFKSLVRDGQYLKKNTILARIKGKARSILSAERVVLNFLTLLSGISTKTYQFVKAVRPYNVKILDTRKTIPLLRELQKYAVRTGGGYNHRLNLSEMVLIKDNHIKVTRTQGHNVTSLIEKAQKKMRKRVNIEIEVENLREFNDALKAAPDIIMLDNMKISDIKKAVRILHGRRYALRHTLLEASGGITLKNVHRVASTGVDLISIGTLTHSINSIDMNLEII